MNLKKIIALVLFGVGLVALLCTVITLGFSAHFVNKVEDETGLDVSLNGGDVKELIGFFEITAEAYGTDVNAFEIVEDEMGMYGYGFHVFSLYARCWFFFFAVLAFVAGAVMMAVAHDAALPGMAWQLLKAFGLAFVGSFAALFAAVKASMSAPKAPKAPKAAKKGAAVTCPGCGASFPAGTQFCAICGTKMPDPALIGVCFNCGVRNDPAARFCANCGKPIGAAPAPAPVSVEPAPVEPAPVEAAAAQNPPVENVEFNNEQN